MMKKLISILTAASLCGSMLFTVPALADDDDITLGFDTSRIDEQILTVSKTEGACAIGSFQLKIAYDTEHIKSLKISENENGAYRIEQLWQEDGCYIVSGALAQESAAGDKVPLFDITECIADTADIESGNGYRIDIYSADDTVSGLYDAEGEEIPVESVTYGGYDLSLIPAFITQYSEQSTLLPPDIEVFQTKEGVSVNITCDTANAEIYYLMEREDASSDDTDSSVADGVDDDGEDGIYEKDFNEVYEGSGTHGELLEASEDEINNIVNNGKKYSGTIKLTAAFSGTIKAVSRINGAYYSEYIAAADLYAEKLNAPIVIFSVEDDRVFVSMNVEYEDAEIYYTTDGTAPNLNSKKFSYDLIFNKRSIPEITARAYMDGYICSDIVYRKYTSSSEVAADGTLAPPVILYSQIDDSDRAYVSISGYYGAEIYYYIVRYDEAGNEIHGNPRLYSDAFQAEEGTTVYAYAMKNGFLKSEETSELIDFSEPEYPFETSDWAKDEVVSTYNSGLMPAELEYSDLTQSITREEFAAVAIALYEKLSGETAEGDIYETPFVDCGESEYASYIAAAYEIGISDGVNDDDTEFDPYATLNREQLATMLCRVIKKCYLPGWSLEDDYNYSLDVDGTDIYPDDYLISDYARQAVYYMAKFGVVDNDDYFNPQDSATIEQALLIAFRAYNAGERFDPDYTELVRVYDEGDTTISENAVASGVCGDNAVWEIDEYGVMTIKGKGAMADRLTVNVAAPWNDYTKDITAVVVKKGITSIGDYAFANMSNMKRIIFPSGLKRIGMHAFYKCTGVEIVEINRGVETIEKYAFSGCTSLKRITVPNGVRRIEVGLFEGCTELRDVEIMGSVTTIGAFAFRKCSNIESIYIPHSVINIANNAFEGCDNLSEIDFGGSMNEWKAALYAGDTVIPNKIKVNYAK